jgi:PQQ-dependent catabolism-associated CXXCW motif protein
MTLLPARSIAATFVALLCLSTASVSAQAPPEPEGYRLDSYRDPTPLTVAGQPGLDTDGARQIWESGGAIFIDVLPAPRRPEGLPEGAVWAPRPLLGIPGGVWLPDLGRGALADPQAARFRRELDRLTGGDRSKPLVFYCRAQCWMSWNATKRALAWGFGGALWYREGPDEWKAAGLPLTTLTPQPLTN